MTKIAVIIGSVRPNRFGMKVGEWFYERAAAGEAEFEVVDVKDYSLPLLNEPVPSGHTQEHTKRWQAKMAEFDGYVIVTPEYNHSIAASLKNALDYSSKEVFFKPVAYVGYGTVGGIRAVEQLRLVAATFKQYDLRAQVVIMQGNFTDQDTDFIPEPIHESSADALIKDINFWAREMAPLRQKLKP